MAHEELTALGLETKFTAFDDRAAAGDGGIEGYASLFDMADRNGDVVAPGAFRRTIENGGRAVKLLWQHDPAQPIGVWDRIGEDRRGLHAEGRLLTEIRGGAEAAALLRAGAVDGLSIGYRVVSSERLPGGGRRLTEIDLWEISLVTFPMLPQARAAGGAWRAAGEDEARVLVEALQSARSVFA